MKKISTKQTHNHYCLFCLFFILLVGKQASVDAAMLTSKRKIHAIAYFRKAKVCDEKNLNQTNT